MSEDWTKKLNEPNSSEARFERMEIRITTLEERQYDTKPLWERALAEIAESRAENAASRSELRAEIEGLRTEIKAGFENMQYKMEHELRGVARKMDVLNQTLFQIQVDQRYFDRQLAELETRIEQQ